MFEWFGRKSASVAAMPRLPEWLQPARDEGFPQSYESRLREVYRSNPVGLRSVRLIAGAVAALDIYGGDEAARLVKKSGILEDVTAALLLHGNAYVQVVSEDGEEASRLASLRPDRVSIAGDGRGRPVALVYRTARQTVRLPLTDDNLRRRWTHLKALNPGDDIYGLGALEAAVPAASIHNKAARWNKALLDNAARPSGALTYQNADGSNLSPDQYERLREEIETQFAGAGNAGRPMLLDGGLAWQAMALSPADMDFVALKESAARDIALAFGVPPVLVGLPGDATYANAREAGRALYRQTVLPMAARILGGLSGLLDDWVGDATLKIDEDKISELAEDRAKSWAQVGAADFLTRAEKREQLGFGKKDGQ